VQAAILSRIDLHCLNVFGRWLFETFNSLTLLYHCARCHPTDSLLLLTPSLAAAKEFFLKYRLCLS